MRLTQQSVLFGILVLGKAGRRILLYIWFLVDLGFVRSMSCVLILAYKYSEESFETFLALSPQISSTACLVSFVGTALLSSTVLRWSLWSRGPWFSLLHIVLSKAVLSFSTQMCFSLLTFPYDHPIPFPEFNVSENPDFLWSEIYFLPKLRIWASPLKLECLSCACRM